ncbi:MAG: hypothetical protein N2Z73_04855, partial [Endomicrobia bacterium]|nr:hypothetical protein [Endomicrobiia bacterium]
MWVNGEVKNKPSDGTERAVANALFVAKLTVDKNTRFKNNDQIKIISPTYLKLGAGTQFGSITFLDKNTICVISSSPLNGVYAKNYYWWKVKYNNQEGWITQDVMCDTIPPPVPQLISPANGIQMYDRNPTFSWSSVKDPDGVYYTLIVSSTPDFSSNIIYIVNLTTSQYIPDQHGDFKVDTTYYWKVKAADRGENESDFSEIYSFVIISSDDITSPGRVDNLYAKSGWLTGSVLLSWTSPGDDDYNGNIQNGMYRIDYATYNKTNWDHRNYKIKITTFVNVYTTQHLLITGLIPNLTYYFCLWTSDEFLQWSQPSNIASTYAKPLPAKPELLLPKDNTLFITTNSVVLMWNTSPEIVNSYIEISTVSNFKTLFTSIVVSDINTYIIHNLDNNTYYWRVCGETEYKEKSLWTSYGKFYVKTSTDIISSDINLLYEQLTPQQINFLFSNVLDVYFNLSVESKILPILISSISFVYKIEEQSIHKNEWHILYPSIDEKTGSYYVQIYNYRGHNLDSINYFNVVYLTNGWILQTPLYKITYVKNKEQLIGLNGGKIILYDTNPYDREAYVEIKQNVLEVDGVVNIQQYAENLPPLTLPGIVSLDPPIAIKISGLSGKNKECGIFCIKYNDIYNPQKIKALYYDGIQWHTTYCWIDTSSMEIKGKLLGDGIYALFVIAEEVNYDNYKPTQNIVFFNKFQRCQVFFPVMTVNPEIEIKIYDIKGRLVKKISKIEYWDGKDEKGQEVPTGTYIYKYIIGGQQYTGTVILLK